MPLRSKPVVIFINIPTFPFLFDYSLIVLYHSHHATPRPATHQRTLFHHANPIIIVALLIVRIFVGYY